MAKKALDGAKVLEFAELTSGPYCAKLLADLGAEVIKVEKPLVGDVARRRGPFPGDIPHSERSGLFLYLNTDKRSVTLDVETIRGKEIFLELVAWADILIEDHLPKELAAWGLTYDQLSVVNPRLVMTSVTPFGQTGPYANYRAYDLNAFHAGGEGYVTPGQTPEIEREPLKAGGHLADFDAGLNAAVATLAARLGQITFGIGQHVDVSKQETLMSSYRVDLVGYPNDGFYNSRATRIFKLGGLLPCKDGYVVVTTAEDHQWLALMDCLGNPEWSRDERMQFEEYRTEHADELQVHLVQEVLKYTKHEIYHQAQASGCPIGIVYDAADLLHSPQMQARELFGEIEHPEAGLFKYPLAPYRFSETPAAVERPAPLLGEHNEAIYCGLLGYTRLDLVKMRQSGII